MIGGHTTIEIFELIRMEMCKLSKQRLHIVHKNIKAIGAYPPSLCLHLLFANIDDGVEFYILQTSEMQTF